MKTHQILGIFTTEDEARELEQAYAKVVQAVNRTRNRRTKLPFEQFVTHIARETQLDYQFVFECVWHMQASRYELDFVGGNFEVVVRRPAVPITAVPASTGIMFDTFGVWAA